MSKPRRMSNRNGDLYPKKDKKPGKFQALATVESEKSSKSGLLIGVVAFSGEYRANTAQRDEIRKAQRGDAEGKTAERDEETRETTRRKGNGNPMRGKSIYNIILI